jgi:hypothetical protein
VHGVSAWAKGFAALLDEWLTIILEIQLDDLRSQSASDHQNLVRSQIANLLFQLCIGFENTSNPTSPSLTRRELLIRETFGLEWFGRLFALIKLSDEGSNAFFDWRRAQVVAASDGG